MGGLTLASALSKCPEIDIDVYEAAPQFSEAGAGIGVWGRPWQILKSLGLEEGLRQLLDVKPTDEMGEDYIQLTPSATEAASKCQPFITVELINRRVWAF